MMVVTRHELWLHIHARRQQRHSAPTQSALEIKHKEKKKFTNGLSGPVEGGMKHTEHASGGPKGKPKSEVRGRGLKCSRRDGSFAPFVVVQCRPFPLQTVMYLGS